MTRDFITRDDDCGDTELKQYQEVDRSHQTTQHGLQHYCHHQKQNSTSSTESTSSIYTSSGFNSRQASSSSNEILSNLSNFPLDNTTPSSTSRSEIDLTEHLRSIDLSKNAADLPSVAENETVQSQIYTKTTQNKQKPFTFSTQPTQTISEHTSISPIKSNSLYQIQEKIRSGGFGDVFKGQRRLDGLPIAIKVIRKEKIYYWSEQDSFNQLNDMTLNTTNCKRLPTEIELMYLVNECEGCIRILDFIERHDRFLIIMERPEKYIDLW